MERIQVGVEKNSYPIYIGEDLLSNFLGEIKDSSKFMLITDTTIERIYGSQIQEQMGHLDLYKYVVCAGEESKNIQTVIEIISEMMKYQFSRHDKIIAFGGGVIGDLAGFTASVYMRGISFIQIPTTLLSQVDSSVGGKTGVNMPQGKNMVGTFYQPEIVIIDTTVLKSLPLRELISGIGEVIKYGIMEDYLLFKYIEKNLDMVLGIDQQVITSIVKNCCEIKARIVAKDEKENNIRKNLNLGHTLAHALEAITEYKTYTHGEAVLIGIYHESKIAKQLGLIEEEYYQEIVQCIEKLGISVEISMYSSEYCLELMCKDKKNRNEKISFILPAGKGEVKEVFLTKEEISLLLLGNQQESFN